jgi:hypothetical protein
VLTLAVKTAGCDYAFTGDFIWVINNASDLLKMRNHMTISDESVYGGMLALGANIDLDNVTIKNNGMSNKTFAGSFDGRMFTLSNELFHVVKDVTNIEGLDWQIRGNIIGLNFNLVDADGAPVATIQKKLVSIRDKYCLGIYKPEQEQVVVAIFIQLQKMLEDRAESSSS